MFKHAGPSFGKPIYILHSVGAVQCVAYSFTGLRLILFVDPDEYLCTSESSGFKFTLQNQTEASFPEAAGFYVNTGVLTSVAISKVKTIRDIVKSSAALQPAMNYCTV